MNDAWAKWQELAAAHAAPPHLRVAATPDPSPGQVWNAYRGQAELLVLITQIHPEAGEFTAWPVTVEPGVETADCVVIEAAGSPMNVDLAAWDHLERTLSIGVLDRVIGEFRFGKPISTRADLLEAVAPARAGAAWYWAVESGASAAISDLQDALDELAAAPLPRSEDSVLATGKLPIPLATVVEATGANQARAMNIIVGKEPVTPSEAEALAQASGLPVETILDHVQPLPKDLELELFHPRWRRLVTEYAVKAENEDAARRTLGYEALALAARQQGAGADQWRQRLQTIERSHRSRTD